MASRRLAISSLLCDDDPPKSLEHVVEPVVLAPHLKRERPQSVAFHSHYPVHSPPPQLPYVGLEALVHAATEERRRLSAGSSTDLETPHQASPPIHEALPRSHHRSPSRQPPEFYVRPFDHSPPAVSPPYEYRLQSPSYSPLNSQPPRHRTHDRLIPDDSQVRLRPVDEMHHRPAYFPSPPPPPPPSSHPHSDHDLLIQQQQLELVRQRQHHDQLLLKEQQQQRQLARERQLGYPNTSTSPSLPPPRIPSMPLHLQVPSPPFSHPQLSPHAAGRKSDQGQHGGTTQIQARPTSAHLNLILSPNTSDGPAFYPSKKRRYSDSPVLPISSLERERLSPDRESAVAAEVSYQHVDPLVVAIPPRSPTPAFAQERKPVAAVELVSPDRESAMEHIPASAVEIPPDGQGLLKPVGRRASPGSQTRKAKAAMKSEEKELSLGSISTERGRPRTSQEPRTPSEERKRLWTRPPSESQTVGEGPTSRAKVPQEVLPQPPPQPTKAQDAHEWFLEHYDDVPLHNEPAAHPPPIPPQTVPAASSSKKHMSIPATMPEAAVALEQELEELVVNSPTIPSKIEPDVDMDVDLAVTELVAETLEPDMVQQHVDVGMEVDVEDELLSLVDDRPLVAHASRRTAPSGMTSLSTKVQGTVSSDAGQDIPSAVSVVSNASLPGSISPAIRSSSARPMSERESMPPPAAPGRGKDKDEKKKAERASSITTVGPTTKKKKEGQSKASAKPRTAAAGTTAKSRAKPGPKLKPKDTDGAVGAPATARTARTSATPAVKKATASRSRSTSAMPGGSVGPEGDPKAEKQEEEEGSDGHEDDKLYCVCKTKYDEDRFMIACDRCDEWYHTQCVNMPDLEVDLVDQFICPPCVERNLQLSLCTTYKRRCLFGLKHADPDSAKACHKPARGAFSKYCSDECGVRYMQTRLDAWAKKGGKKDKLWDSVKDAEKREGVVIRADDGTVVKDENDDGCKREEGEEIKPRKGKIERELERLNALLDQVVKLREEIKKGIEVVVWREKLIELASERAEHVDQCGWDQRLCFGDNEWADFGTGVLESYEDVKTENNQGDMQVDGVSEELGAWWCPGEKMCDRHAGWQAVRQKDVCQEKEKKEEALSNLTTREREIRKRIEDMVDPQGRNCADPEKTATKLSNAKQPNGSGKGKTLADTSKKGKKRKAP